MPVETLYRAYCRCGYAVWSSKVGWVSEPYSTKESARLALKLHRREEHQ